MKERPVSRKSIVKLIILLVLLMVFLASNGIYKWKEQPATSPTAGPIEQDKQTQKPDQGNDNEDKDENINDLHPIAFKGLLMGGSQRVAGLVLKISRAKYQRMIVLRFIQMRALSRHQRGPRYLNPWLLVLSYFPLMME